MASSKATLAKATFTLDDETVDMLNEAAERLDKPKSQVVREAIADYHARIGRLSETERLRMLAVFDKLVPAIPKRPVSEVDAELTAIRQARRSGGRASAARGRK